jgi:polyhydroxybutyrate depolymerase
VEPQAGQQSGWNAGFCCGSGWKQEADDSGFIISLINEIKTENNINNAKVFVVGFSNGAFMAQRLATEHPTELAGAATASGSIGTTENHLKPSKPVPILLMHGEQDETIPFNGGTKNNEPDFNWLSFSKTQQVWSSLNGDQTKTHSIVYESDGHQWHDWRIAKTWHHSPEASQEVFSFFNNL